METTEGLTTKQIIAQRRAALFNIRVKHAGDNDYFGRDHAQDRKLEVERQKLVVLLKVKGLSDKPQDMLSRPGKGGTL